MEFIKLSISSLISEPTTCNGHDRFSHPAFSRKLPKNAFPCDYDKDEKLIEFEFSNGIKHWIKLSDSFGKVIAEVKDIFLLHPDGYTEHLNIAGFEIFKQRRTNYWKLIFERELPY